MLCHMKMTVWYIGFDILFWIAELNRLLLFGEILNTINMIILGLQISQDWDVYLFTSRCYLQIFSQIQLSYNKNIGIYTLYDFIWSMYL
jgi:hypothetical protein